MVVGSAPLSPRENKYIHKPLFVHLRGGGHHHDQGSRATEIILAQMPGEESVGSAERSLGMTRSAWLPGRTAGRLTNRPGQSVSHTALWMYSVEAIDTIVLWRGGWRGIKKQQ